MMLTGNLIAIILTLTSGALDTLVKVRSTEFGTAKVELGVSLTRSSPAGKPLHQPPEVSQVIKTGRGFLFVDGRYCDPSSTLCWSNGMLTLDDPSSSMLAMAPAKTRITDTMSDAFVAPELSKETIFAVSESEMNRIRYALESGGVVSVSSDAEPYTVGFSEGGIELLEAIQTPIGSERDRLIEKAFQRGRRAAPEVQTWLSSYTPDNDLVGRIGSLIDNVDQIEKSNIVAATAMRRFNNWSYPLTITAMMIFVLSMGSLLAARPQELVAVAQTETDVSVNRFLWLIGGMSVIDLVWTLLAHQANQITEVNPVGNILLGDAQRTIMFKALATILAIGILYKARHSLFARKACWWVCLTLALLMARWVLVSGVST